jgi:hypothetical protein
MPLITELVQHPVPFVKGGLVTNQFSHSLIIFLSAKLSFTLILFTMKVQQNVAICPYVLIMLLFKSVNVQIIIRVVAFTEV